jgi:hypothetical protein
MKLEFKGFHPKDTSNEVLLSLTNNGVEYLNLDNKAFQFIPYSQIAGYSGWQPGYGSLHIYSSNVNLLIHVEFPQEVAEEYLEKIRATLSTTF